MRIATWNIYWLGDRDESEIRRSESDYELIARVIRQIAPDVLALQEIVDPLLLEHILDLANGEGRDYVIKSGDSNWLTSDPKPLDPANDYQKVFFCINNATIEFVQGAAILGGPWGRKPYAAKLRERSSGKEFVAVVAHLRAGWPNFLDADEAAIRRDEVEALTQWLGGQATAENNIFPEPDTDDVVILGDFNAQMNDTNQSLAPLSAGNMANWSWMRPSPDGDHWETAIYNGDRYVIDFILFSESLKQKISSQPKIYAWDHDPAMGGSEVFHLGPNGTGDLRGYGVSDHRPVIAEVVL